MRSSHVFLLVGVVAALGGGGAAAHRFLPESPIVRGLQVGSQRVPERTAETADWLAARRDAARARTVRFFHGEQVFTATLDDVGVAIDVGATFDRARVIGRSGPLFKRLREAERARRGTIDVPLAWTVHDGKARAWLTSIAPSIARAPVDARLDLDRHAKIPDVPGIELDVDASLARLREATHEDDEAIPLVVRQVPAKVSLADVTRVEVEKVVASFETTFSLIGTGAGRAINIRNAAAKVDGTIVAPGEIFSFNDVVGPRTKERGFALAPEIQGDELQNGYGGGTCQMSSTLYGAVLFGALEVIARQAHSRPSSYTKMGLDATVSYPLADFKFRNTLPFPVMIHAFLPKPNAVRVELLGGDPIAKVDYTYGVSATEDFVRRVTVKPFLSPGSRIRHQKGTRGYDVTSVVKVTYFDGRVEERRYFSGYRPAPEVFWVAPGYDVDELPPMPEHAKGVEGNALSAPSDSGERSAGSIGG